MYQDEDKREVSERISKLDSNVCIERIGRYMEKNILADLNSGDWAFLLVRDLLVVLKREFEKGYDKLTKVAELIAELKQVEQGLWTIDEFV